MNDVFFFFEYRKELAKEAFDSVNEFFCVSVLVAAAANILVLGNDYSVVEFRIFFAF